MTCLEYSVDHYNVNDLTLTWSVECPSNLPKERATALSSYSAPQHRFLYGKGVSYQEKPKKWIKHPLTIYLVLD